MTNSNPTAGTAGSGAYEGAVWNGTTWERDGEKVKVGSWAQTGPLGKAIVITVGAIVALGGTFLLWNHAWNMGWIS